MKFYEKLKNLFFKKRKSNKDLLNYFEIKWNEFFNSVYDFVYNPSFKVNEFLSWNKFGEIYRQKIIDNMSPILIRNNFNLYFIKNGFVFECNGLEKHL